jgi:hypothetical protein
MGKSIKSIFSPSETQGWMVGGSFVLTTCSRLNKLEESPFMALADAAILAAGIYLFIVAYNLIIWFQDRNDLPD